MHEPAGPRAPSEPIYRSATRPPLRREARQAARGDDAAAAEPFVLADGRPLSLRKIHAGDADALRRAFARLTPEQVRLRLFHRVNELSREAAARMTQIDPDTTIAYVVVDAEGEIRGEARLHIDIATDIAEFALAVDPQFTRRGIGRRLMQRLIEDARARHLYEIWGDVLAENQTMLIFARTLGAERHAVPGEPGLVRIRLPLAS